MLKIIWRIPRNIAVTLLSVYQKSLSPDHSFWSKKIFPGGYCRYYPTCSEYWRLALQKYGFIWGCAKGLWRILRCNPWSKGGENQP